MTELLFLLVCGHCLGDFALQTPYMSAHKDHTNGDRDWLVFLFAHSFIHGMIVFLITQFIWIAVAEIILHVFVDHTKCCKYIGLKEDQIAHITCKVIYCVIIAEILTKGT